MKKMIIILCVLFTLILTGTLYGTKQEAQEEETRIPEQAYMKYLPDIVIDPMVGFTLY